MSEVHECFAFNAFESQLKTLCIKEFPCGLGKWRESLPKIKQPTKIRKQKDLPHHRFSITHRDYGAVHEQTENLEELVTATKSPWNLDYSWSNEAKELREIAVRSPWLIDDNFVFSHFRTLRIVDKEVTEVDSKLLLFKQLEELSLSANQLKTVNSRHLPSSLRLLELCANQIHSLAELCVKPPPKLLHLGLGYNCISMVDDYITGHYWPKLLSLDLSHNNLCDLMDIIKKLSTLPKLRNLILQGNPLALVAGYRGYTIDCLRLLDALDDIPISADEKHHYKGLAKRKEYILDEGKIILSVDYIRGVPMPEELRNAEEQPEYPVISRKYYVQFMFLEDRTQTAEMLDLFNRERLTSASFSDGHNFGVLDGVPEGSINEAGYKADILGTKEEEITSQVGESVSGDKNVAFAQKLEKLPQSNQEYADGGENRSLADDQDAQREQAATPVKLGPIKSAALEWAEDIELNWQGVFARDDLLHLRDFLKDGMDISIMEEKIESFPAEKEEEPSPAATPKGGKSAKGGKGDKKDDKKTNRSRSSSAASHKRTKSKSGDRKTSANKKKDEKSKGGKTGQKANEKEDKKKAGKDAGKDKKKKKGEPEVELSSLPPEYTTLATFHVPLEDFLDGEKVFANVYFKASTESGGTTPASEQHVSKKGKVDDPEEKVDDPKEKVPKSKEKKAANSKDKKDKDKKKKPSSADKKGKDRGKSPKSDKKSVKGDKDKKAPILEDEGPPPPPPPLEVSICVRLHHWETAMDSLKDEKLAQANVAQEAVV